MKPTTELALNDDRRDLAASPAQMMQSMIDRGVTSENATAFEKLVELQWKMQDRDAKRDFAEAFNRLQREMPRIKATKIIPSNNGQMRSAFAPFEEIDAQLRPIALAHGFTYSFSEGEFSQARVTKICNVQHSGGHERSNSYSVRIGKGPPGCSESQADGAAHSYAKRGALCDAFCIVVAGIDNDARAEGAPITEEQAFELERRVAELNADKTAFLKMAGASTYGEIASAKYSVLDEMLKMKERKAKR